MCYKSSQIALDVQKGTAIAACASICEMASMSGQLGSCGDMANLVTVLKRKLRATQESYFIACSTDAHRRKPYHGTLILPLPANGASLASVRSHQEVIIETVGKAALLRHVI